jgi:hypothetical protein
MGMLLALGLLAQDADEIAKLIEKLGSDEIAEREAAEKKLVELGEKAEPSLKKAADLPGEQGARAKAALRKIELARLAKKKFVYSAWESWDAFGHGSSVEFEMETAGMKLRQTKKLDRRTEGQITLATEVILSMGGNEMKTPGEEPVKKDAAGAEGKCPLCGQPVKGHDDLGTWGAEMLKIDGQDLACTTYETPAMNCAGQATPQVRMWYSRDVPGHIVKMTTAQLTMTAVKFEAKPKSK